MDIQIRKTFLPGCLLIRLPAVNDKRGTFVKIFHAEAFKRKKLETYFPEEYYSFSYKRVIRGLHFQVPPYEHTKLVCCINGIIFDAIVDLRKGSPTFNQYMTFILKGDDPNLLFIPPGLAHGFLVQSEYAIMLYKVSSQYSPMHDRGILWNSVRIPWPVTSPIVSERDQSFPELMNFKTPFVFKQEKTTTT
jgi:dTDP-4-dehydrorhamnose 3,5-epimerase